MNDTAVKKKHGFVDFFITLILLAAFAVFIIAGYKLFCIVMEYCKGLEEYSRIETMVVTERDPDEIKKAENGGENVVCPITVDFDTLRAINTDVIGWIYVEAIDGINYPVVHGKDNDEYLHATYERVYNFAGTIFIDHANATDFSDPNTIVYGHNMRNGSMFGSLKKFINDENCYATSKYFWILTPERNFRYEVIAAYTTPVNSDTYTLFAGPGTEFAEYLNKIVEKSQIQTTPGNLTIDDKIVTLSTCTGDSSTRFVVQGKINGIEKVN